MTDLSAENYFLKWANHARHLDHYPDDEEIIELLKWHFSQSIVDRVEMRQPRTTWEMARLLGQADGKGFLENEKQKARGTDEKKTNNKQYKSKPNWFNKQEKDQKSKQENQQTTEEKPKPKWNNNKRKDKDNTEKRNIRTIEVKGEISDAEWEDADTDYEDEQQDTESEETEKNVIEEDNKTGSPLIMIKIGQIETEALLDTGAHLSAVSETMLTKIQEKSTIMQLPICNVVIKGILGAKKKIKKQVRLNIQLNEEIVPWTFIVIPKMSNEVILGIDILKYLRTEINIEEEFVEFKKIQKKIKFDKKRLMFNLNLEEDLEEDIKTLVKKFPEVFEDSMGTMIADKVKINMLDKRPFKGPMYPIADIYMEKARTIIKQMEEDGIIQKSATEYLNPLVVQKKKDGTIKLCLDARMLNKRMEGDTHQPPTIEEIVNKMGESKWFSTIDIKWAFLNLELDEESMKYTGFLFDGSTYIYRRLPFGLKISTGRFTREFKRKLSKIDPAKIIVYIDEILIHTKTRAENLEILHQVLKEVKEMNVRVKLEKTQLAKNEVKFLGHTFQEHVVMMTNETKQCIIDFPVPTNKRKLQSFMGITNWDRRFIPNLAALMRPLMNLLKQENKFKWGQQQQEAFDKIKQAFMNAEKLYIIQKGWQFAIQTDASLSGLGARLYQTNGEQQNTIAYASRTLSTTEMRYTTTEIEALSVIYALDKWRIWLYGRPIIVETDHIALTFLLSCRLSNMRITRWIIELAQFNISWKHIRGEENIIADALSRRDEKKNTVKNEVLIRELRPQQSKWAEIRNWLIQEQLKQTNELQKIKEKVEWISDSDGLIRLKHEEAWKTWLPETTTDITIKLIHIYLLHAGSPKLFIFVKQNFIGKNLKRKCEWRSKCCDLCQRSKYYTRRTEGKYHIELPNEPKKQWSLDIFGPLCITTFGHKYLIVILDRFTKDTKLLPVRNIKADTVVNKVMNYMRGINTYPKKILTDKGSQFKSTSWKNWARENNIQIQMTTPYNPNGNPVERVMKEIGRILRTYCHDQQTNWFKYIGQMEDYINNTYHSAAGATPNEIQGKEGINLPINLSRIKTNNESISIEQVKKNLKKAANKEIKWQANNKKPHPGFEIKSRVLRKTHAISNKAQKKMKKLSLLYDRPWTIIGIIRDNAYKLKNEKTGRRCTINARRLRPYYKDNIPEII